MKKRELTYSLYQKQIKDKDTAVNSFIDRCLAKTQSMFKYDGLPDTIPQTVLERNLQENGTCYITEIDGKLYALIGGLGGESDVYYRPTLYTVANPALNLSKSFVIRELNGLPTDAGVLMQNDSNGQSLMALLGKYAVLYADSVISLNTASVLTRITMLISASDDKTKESADEFIAKILNGDFSVIGENAFFKGVNLQTAPTANANYINQLIELVQYYKASLYNELGLNANYNMKRERLNLGEVSMNIDVLLPYVDNMLTERKKAVERINELYGTEITVDLSSTWKLNHENYEKTVADVETDAAGNDTPPTDADGNDTPPTDTDGNDTPPTDTDGNDTPPTDADVNPDVEPDEKEQNNETE